MTAATPSSEPWTILRLLQWTTDHFKRRSFDSPRLDAEVLLASALNCRRIELYTAFDKEPDAAVRDRYRDLVRRRGEGTPVAYLVGHKEFYSIDLTVTSAVLIPRPETEHVVIEALDFAKTLKATEDSSRTLQVIDVGTGSGAIAIALAKHLKPAEIIAIERSPAALEVARDNVRRHELDAVIKVVAGDLLSEIPESPTFDLIVSNPPYITDAEYAELSPEVRNFEPREALVSGTQGTEVITRLREQAATRLRPGGRLILEFSPMIAKAVQAEFEADPRWTGIKIIKDLAQHARVLSAARAPA